MNTENNLTPVQESQEDISTRNVSSSSTEGALDNNDASATIKELEEIHQSLINAKLHLYEEQIKVKDEIIKTLNACIESYKIVQDHNNEWISLLKTKVLEKMHTLLAARKAHRTHIADYEAIVQEKNDQITLKDKTIKDKEDHINELNEQLQNSKEMLKDKMLSYGSRITLLESNLYERDIKIYALESKRNETEAARAATVNDGENHILSQTFINKDEEVSKLEAELLASGETIQDQYNCLIQYTAKELQQSAKDEGQIKVVSLPRFSSLKVTVKSCIAGPDWIVIHRRMDFSASFHQDWLNYVYGFGDIQMDFWIGLEKINALTHRQQHELFVHVESFENEISYAHYDNFSIGGKDADYILESLGNYVGNAGDELRHHEHQIFRTVRYETENILVYNRWWHNRKPTCNLNGSFTQQNAFGVWWGKKNETYSFLRCVQMLIRPKQS